MIGSFKNLLSLLTKPPVSALKQSPQFHLEVPPSNAYLQVLMYQYNINVNISVEIGEL